MHTGGIEKPEFKIDLVHDRIIFRNGLNVYQKEEMLQVCYFHDIMGCMNSFQGFYHLFCSIGPHTKDNIPPECRIYAQVN